MRDAADARATRPPRPAPRTGQPMRYQPTVTLPKCMETRKAKEGRA
jgi:hypothetical protein